MTENAFGSDHSAKFRYKFYNSLAKDAQKKADEAMRAMNVGAVALGDIISAVAGGADGNGYEQIDGADHDHSEEHGNHENTPLITREGFLAPPAHIVPTQYYKIHLPLRGDLPSVDGQSSIVTM